MQRGLWAAVGAVLVMLALSAPASADRKNPINAYRVKATAANIKALGAAGFDVTEGQRAGGIIEVFGTAGQFRKLRDNTRIAARIVKDRNGRTSAARSARIARIAAKKSRRRARAAQASSLTGSDAAYKVWRRYDRVAGDGKEQYLELYDRMASSSLFKKVKVGETYLGRDLIALKMTRNAKNVTDGTRPAVLYNSLQHAREWLAGETCRRSMLYFADNYGEDEQITRLVNTRELWFYCVANPDGYEYTFTPGNRLWRKNMANNNGGAYGEVGDGVDPNRNFPVSWGLDDEGSSPDPVSETYRGPGPASEPETKAMLKLWDIGNFEFQKNDHTAASLILYPQGWQQYTPAADDPIFTALAGTDKDPAINSFDPDLGAELYITNGDTLDTAYNERGILAYTPEGTPAKDPAVSGFEYEDSEGAIQAEFQRHREFVVDLAESAADPANPKSHLRNTVQDFYVDTFPESHGDPQTVQVLAKRSLGDLVLRWKVNGGATQEDPTTVEWSDGERYYQEAGRFYHRMRGTVTGTTPGDSVEVWFATKDGKKRSASFTYKAIAETKHPVLVMSAEDYSGPTPAQTGGAKYAQSYVEAINANGIGADLYDVDARGRRAPHPLGILSHYKMVVWSTGDDYITREPGQVPGTGSSRLAVTEMIAVRDFINEGGKLVYAGKHAGQQYVEGFEFRNFGFPQPGEAPNGKWCDSTVEEAKDGCVLHNDDFLQYYLGAYIRADNGNSWANNKVVPALAVSPFGGQTFQFADQTADPGAGAPTATFGITSSLIDNPTYQDSKALARWQRPAAGPFSPLEGSYYMAASHDDEAYKRLATTVDIPVGETARLQFSTSYDLEPNWDYIFVEVKGADGQWTTLPDSKGHTGTGTGDSCWEDGGWWQLHSRLLNYQTVNGEDCVPTGTGGAWNAATGNSSGWQEWDIDLSGYAGQKVEVAIVVATDWAFGGLGAWVDQAKILVGGATSSATSFETDMGVWTAGPSPAGTPNAAPQWERSPQQFDEAAVVGTTDTVYAGFEAGTLATADDREAFMGDALRYLGVLTP